MLGVDIGGGHGRQPGGRISGRRSRTSRRFVATEMATPKASKLITVRVRVEGGVGHCSSDGLRLGAAAPPDQITGFRLRTGSGIGAVRACAERRRDTRRRGQAALGVARAHNRPALDRLPWQQQQQWRAMQSMPQPWLWPPFVQNSGVTVAAAVAGSASETMSGAAATAPPTFASLIDASRRVVPVAPALGRAGVEQLAAIQLVERTGDRVRVHVQLCAEGLDARLSVAALPDPRRRGAQRVRLVGVEVVDEQVVADLLHDQVLGPCERLGRTRLGVLPAAFQGFPDLPVIPLGRTTDNKEGATPTSTTFYRASQRDGCQRTAVARWALATSAMMSSRAWVGPQPIISPIFEISGTRRCMSSKPSS